MTQNETTTSDSTGNNTLLGAGRAHTELNRDQKLLAIKLRYYDGLEWNPKKGDYYTSCRNDLELYQIVGEDENYFETNYCNPIQTTPKPAQWPKVDFKKGFSEKRIYVPDWILGKFQWCDSCGKVTLWVNDKCENYK